MQADPVVCLMQATLLPGQAETPSIATPGSPEAVRVIRVIDGDTIVVFQAGKSVRVCLIGLDCPEAGEK